MRDDEKAVLLLRMPGLLRNRVKAQADAERRSMSNWIIVLIETELARQEALARSRDERKSHV